ARVEHRAVLLADGTILVAGGFGPEDAPINVEIYDPSSEAWRPTLPLITGREGHSAFRLASGKVLLVGGFNFDDEDASGTSELYDPASAVARAPVLPLPTKRLTEGFHFEFRNTPGLAFTVLSASTPDEPLSSWTPIGTAIEVLPGEYEFTDTNPSQVPQR